MKQKGFTLIELLVVIAVIGVLSSIVIANVTLAKRKAYDAGLRRVMQQFNVVMSDLIIDNNYVYGTSFPGGSWGLFLPSGTYFMANATNTSKTSALFQSMMDNSDTLTHTILGTGKGFWVESNPASQPYFWQIVLKSKTGDLLCMDSLSNKIYKVQTTILSSGSAANGCTYFE